MRVKIIKAQPAYKIGDEYEVTNHDKDYYEYGHQLILKSDCTIIPDEPGNRVPFNYEVWKEKGGKVWCRDRQVLDVLQSGYCMDYIVVFGPKDLDLLMPSELTMSAPDEVWYANVYVNKISSGHRSIEECKKVNLVTPLHILEINITKGTNKIVHTYNEKV